jgi:hypothetical protein
MEWIILDDGTDKIGDLISEAKIPQIKYVEVERKCRSVLNEICRTPTVKVL